MKSFISASLLNFQLDITPDWFIGADELQWVLCQKVTLSPMPKVKAMRFITSNKQALAVAVAEFGLFNREDLFVEALTFLSAPPFTFKDWVLLYAGNLRADGRVA